MAKRFSGFFIIFFSACMLVMAFFVLGPAYNKVESPTFEAIWTGKWTPEFEKKLNETLPVETPSREFWGSAEYAAFGQGRKGVVLGLDGWLFTDEEYSCLRGAAAAMDENLAYVKTVAKSLKDKNIELVVALVPAKVRVYPEHLGTIKVPSCREDVYTDALRAIGAIEGVKALGLLDVMQNAANKDSLFLKTDTHWTPEGARTAAIMIADAMKDYKFPEMSFKTSIGAESTHDGDLLRYLPGVGDADIGRDRLLAYATAKDAAAQGGDAAADLFGESVPPVTLVGTSYSANLKWNFPGFLQEFLKADVLNMADEGMGPFTVMQKYLASDALKNTPPAVVVWEMPERYLTVKQDYKSSPK